MPFRLTKLLLAILTLAWGTSSVQALVTPASVPSSPVTNVSNHITTASPAQSPEPSNQASPPNVQETAVPTVSPKKSSKHTQAAVVAQPVITTEPTSFNHTQTSAPIASIQPITPSPVPQISYKISAPGVNLEGQIETSGESVGQLTQKIAQKHRVTFVYQPSELGWFITEIAGVKQNPAKNQYWLFYVNGAFSQTGADKTFLQPGDTLTWQLSS